MKIMILLAMLVLCLLSEAFFSGSEIAFICSSRVRMKVLADQGLKRASLIEKLLRKPERILATTLIGTNASVIASSFAANELFAELFGRSYSGFAIFVLVPMVLLFGEILPKSVAMRNAERLALFSIYPLYLSMILLYPVISFAGNLAMMLFGLSTLQKGQKNLFMTREELKIILRSEKNLRERYETAFLNRLLHFAKGRIKDHMTPASRIVSVPKQSTIQEIVQTIQKSGYSRIPVYEGREDNMIGIVETKDLLEGFHPEDSIDAKIRKVLVVKEEERLHNLLQDFQKERAHFAIVKNKFGKVSGIITIEDVLEEIVGEILDEFDKPIESLPGF